MIEVMISPPSARLDWKIQQDRLEQRDNNAKGANTRTQNSAENSAKLDPGRHDGQL
jgi:hypothetical protein